MEKTCWKKTKDLEEKLIIFERGMALVQSTNQLTEARKIITPFLLVFLKLCIPTPLKVNA